MQNRPSQTDGAGGFWSAVIHDKRLTVFASGLIVQVTSNDERDQGRNCCDKQTGHHCLEIKDIDQTDEKATPGTNSEDSASRNILFMVRRAKVPPERR